MYVCMYVCTCVCIGCHVLPTDPKEGIPHAPFLHLQLKAHVAPSRLEVLLPANQREWNRLKVHIYVKPLQVSDWMPSGSGPSSGCSVHRGRSRQQRPQRIQVPLWVQDRLLQYLRKEATEINRTGLMNRSMEDRTVMTASSMTALSVTALSSPFVAWCARKGILFWDSQLLNQLVKRSHNITHTQFLCQVACSFRVVAFQCSESAQRNAWKCALSLTGHSSLRVHWRLWGISTG